MFTVINSFTGRKYRHRSQSEAAKNILKLQQAMPGFGSYITCVDDNRTIYVVDLDAAQPKRVTGRAPRYRLVEVDA